MYNLLVYSHKFGESSEVSKLKTRHPAEAKIRAFRRPIRSAINPKLTAPRKRPKIESDEITDDLKSFSQIRSNSESTVSSNR